MRKTTVTRREFLKGTAALGGATLLAGRVSAAQTASVPTAVDEVVLGKTGLRLSRLGFGTGAAGGRFLRAMSSSERNYLLHHAFDQGIRYIDTAQAYRTHEIVGEAIKGHPREDFFILSKIPEVPEDPLSVVDGYRQELGVDYIDCLLLHCMINADWESTHARVMDALSEAKSRGWIRAHGISCHSLSALQKSAESDWVEVNLVRFNPQMVCTDTISGRWLAPSSVSDLPFVRQQMTRMRENGHGLIGMKIFGNGDFRQAEDRERSIRYATQPGLVDAMTIGFKAVDEVDEAISRLDQALAYHHSRSFRAVV